MSNFEHRRIGGKPEQKELQLEERKESPFKNIKQKNAFQFPRSWRLIFEKKKKWQWYIAVPVLVFSFYLIVNTLFAIYDSVSEKRFVETLFTPVLADLEKDGSGFINVLLIGEGGEGHDGGDLSDTIMVASINPTTPDVFMLSIPRDLWVSTDKFGSSRINEIYRNTKNRLEAQFDLEEDVAKTEATKIFVKEVENIVGLDIPYYSRIDFSGFKDIVDALGGVKVVVENDIYDANYPDGNWGVELFELSAGEQTLDGETALKYARSRHGTSDFDRAARQQQVIQALKDKALSLGLLSSPRKIKNLLSVVQQNFNTNLSIREIITLAFLGKNVDRSAISSAVLNDDWESRGGFLGTPPRADYGGAFVLIPYSGETNYERIHIFTDLFFHYRSLQFSQFEVLNGTRRSGLATTASKRLERYGIPVSSVGNAPNDDFAESEMWIYTDNSELYEAFELLQEIFPMKLVDKRGYYEETDVAATFVIGRDYK